MASKLLFLSFLILFLNQNVESASFLERSYEIVLKIGKSFAPNVMTILDCLGEDDSWGCAKERAGKMLESWNDSVEQERKKWQDAADAEVQSSGRAIEELPSKLGRDVEESLFSLADAVQHGVARALSRHHDDDSGGIDTITISTGSGDKKKKMKKKKKQKPAKIHLIQMAPAKTTDDRTGKVQSWVIGGRIGGNRTGRDLLGDMWVAGEKALDVFAEHAMKNEEVENGVEDKSSLQEQRGKKKKKKKAILKLLILGAVLKAKIGTLLQILSFKLQVKFFLIALIGLAINLARFWLDLKKSHHQQPQKVIYYEHAQHQHHYDHDEHEEPGWGPWQRSMEPEEVEAELDQNVNNSPYRAQIDRQAQTYNRPAFIRV